MCPGSQLYRAVTEPLYLAALEMARTATEIILITICAWLELDQSKRAELLDKVEGMSDCLAKIIRHIGFSCITEHLTTVWILSRRTLCVLRGIPVENTENITIASLGAIRQRPRGFRALRDLDRTALILEIDMALSVLDKWILACPPNEPLEDIIALTQETLEDILAIIEV